MTIVSVARAMIVRLSLVCPDTNLMDKYFPLTGAAIQPRPGDTADIDHRRASAILPVDADKTLASPGAQYAIYHAHDVFGTLPDAFQTVLERGSRIVGVEATFICGVVENFERRLVRWWKRKGVTSDDTSDIEQ